MNRLVGALCGLWLCPATLGWTQELPKDFGNPWMSNLVEVQAPPPVPWWPPAPGWYVVAGLVLLILLRILWTAWRHWRNNAYRREALSRLAAIEELAFTPDSRRTVLSKLPTLLKQTALAAYPREQVAMLSGEQWTAFLDASLGAHEFRQGSARIVGELAYSEDAAQKLDEEELKQVFAAVRRWIRRHDARFRVGEALE